MIFLEKSKDESLQKLLNIKWPLLPNHWSGN